MSKLSAFITWYGNVCISAVSAQMIAPLCLWRSTFSFSFTVCSCFTWSRLLGSDMLQKCVSVSVCVNGNSQTWLSWPHFRDNSPLARFQAKGKYLYIIWTTNIKADLWGQSHSMDTHQKCSNTLLSPAADPPACPCNTVSDPLCCLYCTSHTPIWPRHTPLGSWTAACWKIKRKHMIRQWWNNF